MFLLPNLSVDEILVYLRKSRTDDPALSVEEVLSKHEQMLDEYVERQFPNAGRIPESNRYREVVSGETIESRPKVQELLRRIETPLIKAVLIVEPQRLSRGDLEDIGRIVKLLRYSNTFVITLQYTYDLRDERDRDAFERELKRGNEFLEYQKRIMNNGRLLSAENGNFLGSIAPFGYRKVAIKEGKRKSHTLEIDPEQAPVVRMIFEMAAQGISNHAIAAELNRTGVPTAKGGKWNATGICSALSNEHYIGMVRWNRRKTVKLVEAGEVIARRPRADEYLLHPGKHEPIISQDLWDAVQALRAKLPPVKDRLKCTNPFAGLVYCSCGAPMVRRIYKKQGKERSAPRLLCTGQTGCGTPSCSVEEMVTSVTTSLRDAIADFDLKIAAAPADGEARHRQLIERLEKRLSELDKQELMQWEKYTQEKMPQHIFEQLNEKVLNEKNDLRKALSEAHSTKPEIEDRITKRETFRAALDLLQDPAADALSQNLLLKKCIKRIVYNRHRPQDNNRKRPPADPIDLDIRLHL